MVILDRGITHCCLTLHSISLWDSIRKFFFEPYVDSLGDNQANLETGLSQDPQLHKFTGSFFFLMHVLCHHQAPLIISPEEHIKQIQSPETRGHTAESARSVAKDVHFQSLIRTLDFAGTIKYTSQDIHQDPTLQTSHNILYTAIGRFEENQKTLCPYFSFSSLQSLRTRTCQDYHFMPGPTGNQLLELPYSLFYYNHCLCLRTPEPKSTQTNN